MRNVEQACARFAARARVRRSGRCEEQVDAAGVERYRAGQELDESVIAGVRPVLDAHAVPHRFWVLYYNFARRLARLRRRYGARTLEFETVIAKNIAFARGLDDRIVEEIEQRAMPNAQTPKPNAQAEVKDEVARPRDESSAEWGKVHGGAGDRGAVRGADRCPDRIVDNFSSANTVSY